MVFTVTSLGEKAIVVRLEQQISEQVHHQIFLIQTRLEQEAIVGVIELVPAYCSIVIHYDPYIVWKYLKQHKIEKTAGQYMLDTIEKLVYSTQQHEQKYTQTTRIVEIPVCYGGNYGPDLKEVARYNDISVEDVVAIHSGKPYFVHMLGFAPGFPYLGGMDKRIAMPRKAIPRPAIEAGSIGIAGEQTGIYPISTPGGWRIIGRTPLQLFHPENEMPTLIQAGDYIKFIPISAEQFTEISRKQWT